MRQENNDLNAALISSTRGLPIDAWSAASDEDISFYHRVLHVMSNQLEIGEAATAHNCNVHATPSLPRIYCSDSGRWCDPS
jgi:hypothetical protein